MNASTRVRMIRAMDFVARHLNDEDIFFGWLLNGVADEDYLNSDEYLEHTYCDDKTFAEIMDCFVRVMKRAYSSGGLYCDGIVTKEGNR